MPIYQYQCSHCNLRFELKQSFNAAPTASCPECQEMAYRLFSPVPVLFRGPGFYITDHAKPQGKVKNSSN